MFNLQQEIQKLQDWVRRYPQDQQAQDSLTFLQQQLAAKEARAAQTNLQIQRIQQRTEDSSKATQRVVRQHQ